MEAVAFTHETGGTTAQVWASAANVQAATWLHLDDVMAGIQRLVVVAPHPDDEVLGCGGLLARLSDKKFPLLLVSVTRGEACYPGSTCWTTERLSAVRPKETAQALQRLGWQPKSFEWVQLGLPDSAVAAHVHWLETALDKLLNTDDLLVTTWHKDGHADHEASGRACLQICADKQIPVLQMPLWAMHWSNPATIELPWKKVRKLGLSQTMRQKKKAAVACFHSQLAGDPHLPVQPILGPEMLGRADLPFEIYIA